MSTAKIDPELIPAVAKLQSVLGQTACFDLNDLATARATVAAMTQAGRAAAPSRPSVLVERKSIHDEQLNINVHVDLYQNKRTPTNTPPRAAIVYLHGGGYVLGSADQAYHKLATWCEELGVSVVSVEYRLAPEHPFPAGLLDSFAALKWLATHADELHIDNNRIAIVGESAGGGLAAGLCLYARDNSDIQVALQCLIYPMLDHTNVDSSSRANNDAARPLWNLANNTFAWQAYLSADISDDMLQYASPITASNLQGLPATYIAVGDQDIFFIENQNFADKLQSAGVDTKIESYIGGFHGFSEVDPTAKISQRFNRDVFNALQAALHNEATLEN